MPILCFCWQVLTWMHHGRAHVHFVLLLTRWTNTNRRIIILCSVDRFWREQITDGHLFILCFYWQVLTWIHHGRPFFFILCFYWQGLTWTHCGRPHVHFVLLLTGFDVNTSRTCTYSFCASIDRFWNGHITDGHMFILCFYWQVLTWTHHGRTHAHYVLLLTGFDVNTSRTGTGSTGGSSRGSSSSGHHSDLINQLGDAGDVKQFLSSEVWCPLSVTYNNTFTVSVLIEGLGSSYCRAKCTFYLYVHIKFMHLWHSYSGHKDRLQFIQTLPTTI